MAVRYLRIRAQDVNGEQIGGCRIEAQDDLNQSLTSETGDLAGMTGGQKLQIALSHPLYASETVNIVLASPAWDLPTAQVDVSPNQVSVLVTLVRMTEMPTFLVDDKDLELEVPEKGASAAEADKVNKRNDAKLRALDARVTGVLSQTGPDGKNRYRWMDQAAPDFTVTDTKPGPVLTGSDRAGWDRFRTKTRKIDVLARGQFFLVQYGGMFSAGTGADQSLMVALYIPDLDAGSAVSQRDVIVFLPPNTAKVEYQTNYPFGLTMWEIRDKDRKPEKRGIQQPFVTLLGAGYMFGRHFLAHQLLANDRKAVLVLPVWRQGPADFLDPRVMLRLVREAAAFAHKKRSAGIRRPAALAAQPSLPEVGAVALAAYSASADYLQTMLSEQAAAQVLAVRSTPERVARLSQVWREAIDLDAGASEAFDAALTKWKGRDERRGIRVVASGYRGRTDADLARGGTPDRPLLGRFVTGRILRASGPTSPATAVETYTSDGGLSALITTQAYLQRDIGERTPKYGWDDVHQFVPNFGLAWAIANTKIR